jgi:hypothetical protein
MLDLKLAILETRLVELYGEVYFKVFHCPDQGFIRVEIDFVNKDDLVHYLLTEDIDLSSNVQVKYIGLYLDYAGVELSKPFIIKDSWVKFE